MPGRLAKFAFQYNFQEHAGRFPARTTRRPEPDLGSGLFPYRTRVARAFGLHIAPVAGGPDCGDSSVRGAYETMAQKVDLKKTYKDLFSARRTPRLVEVPRLSYFMIDGQGPPAGEAFQVAIQALYSTAYTIKFALKAAGRTDFVAPPLEALWWSADPRAFEENRRDVWYWTLMLMLPEHVGGTDLQAALDDLERKRKRVPAHDLLRLATLEEERAVQALYVGPYDDMGPAIDGLHAFAASNGYRPAGRHHDIYLSDPRRSAPEKLKTILRRPVAPLP